MSDKEKGKQGGATRFKKGCPKPPNSGRKKGAGNEITKDIRNVIFQAFAKAGGVTYLEKVAEDHPKVFCTLLAKVIPTEIKVDILVHEKLTGRLLAGRERVVNAKFKEIDELPRD